MNSPIVFVLLAIMLYICAFFSGYTVADIRKIKKLRKLLSELDINDIQFRGKLYIIEQMGDLKRKDKEDNGE